VIPAYDAARLERAADWFAENPAAARWAKEHNGDPWAIEHAHWEAEQLMDAAGVGGWELRIGSGLKEAGSIWYVYRPGTKLWDGNPGRLTLSGPLMSLWTPRQRRDTILHEIAHALCPDDGHGRVWRDWCTRFGISPTARWGKEGEARIA
jgi:hypothetical protein